MLLRSRKESSIYYWVDNAADEIRQYSFQLHPTWNYHLLKTWRPFRGIRCIDVAHNVGSHELIAAGSASGGIALFSADSTEILAEMNSKHSRPCNSVAFCTSRKLAAGFGRSKNEASLKIWDVNSLSDDAEVNPYLETTVFEGVASLSYLAKDETLLVGSNSRSLHLVDLRQGLEPTASFTTLYYNHITRDPFADHYFTACSYDGHIGVFDKRYLSRQDGLQLVLSTFNSTKRGTLTDIRYSRRTSGKFATLTDSALRVWQTAPYYLGEDASNMGGPSETISVIQQRTVAESSEQEIQAFDFISHPNASSLCEQLVGMIDGKPALLEPLTHPPAMTFGANNAFSAAFDHYVVMYSSENDNTSPEKPLDGTESVSENSIMSTSIAHGADYNTFGSFESHADNCLPVNKILRTDVLMAIKKRALSNYEFDCAHNAALVNDHFLKDVWNWIGLCHERQKNEPLYNELPVDFAFQGVLGLWFMSTGFSHFLDVLEYKPSRATQQMYLKSASALVSKLGRDVYTAKNTNKPLRQLGMIICGVDCSIQELDSRLEQLVHSNQIIDAVGLALFHGRIESVVRVLSAGNDQERMLSTAVAGYITAQGLTHSGSDSLWKEMCRNLSTELEEPYLRAVFAYIGNSDWRDVLDELSLPLRDRLGVALRFLPDEDLSKYLEDLCRNVVTTGDPEGLLLTGLTPLGIDLLQNYVNQTSDIQTSALISSFVVPLKFTDERADCWISSYRNLLNQWQLFHKRAFFDIGRNELSKNRKGEITLRRIVQPFYVRCNYCKKSFSFSAAEKQAAVLSKGGRKFVDTSKRSACPRCHQQLPVCCVCGLSLGMSITNNDSRRKSVVYGISSSTAHCDEWLSFCLSCGHGMHAVHAKEWFSRHHVCPMATCNCRCTHS